MPSSTVLDTVLDTYSSLRRRASSIRGLVRSTSTSSQKSTGASLKSKRSSIYQSYTVYEQAMAPAILRDPEASRKVFEAILESPNGKRSLSRLARTCKALAEPALDVLWRELDSLVPVLGLFPSHLMKKARRPGLGLTKLPAIEDWSVVLKYSDKVRKVSYDENSNNIATSIFPLLKESRPRPYILPRLLELSWKAETPAGLDRCDLFLNPGLRVVNLEIGTRFPQLNSFLSDMANRTRLTGFSFISPTTLPDSFTDLLLRQDSLQSLVLVAPGALSPGVGRWTASLPRLKSLQLDLSGRAMIAVEGFFDELRPRSGDSTPSSVGSTDSGIFSGEELDFSEIRKSALRLTGDLESKKSFAHLRKLHLTGDASNIAVFLKHITSPLVHLELVMEDPPEKYDWQDLASLICERFALSLQSLRIVSTSSSRFMELIRGTPRAAEPASGRLSLECITSLPHLTRLEIDLPESVIFTAEDIKSLAKACPKLEVLKLCPLAKFPTSSAPPKVTLETVTYLISQCRRLHTLSIVVNAKAEPAVLESRAGCSTALLRFHAGHSWIADPFQVAILLSDIAPRLETLKWFQEKNRPGFNETNSKGWQSVLDALPHLQSIRMVERQASPLLVEAPRPPMFDKGIDARPDTRDRGVNAVTTTSSVSVQFSPNLVSRLVEARPSLASASVDATPSIRHTSVDACVLLVNQGIDARPSTVSTAVDASVTLVSKSIETFTLSSPKTDKAVTPLPLTTLFHLPAIMELFSLLYRIIAFPLSFPSRILGLIDLKKFYEKKGQSDSLKPASSNDTSVTTTDIALTNLQENYDKPFDEVERTKPTEREEMKTVEPPNAAVRPIEEVQVTKWIRKGNEQTKDNKNATRHFTFVNQNSPSWQRLMADNKKQERDFTKEVDVILPEAAAVIKSGHLQDGLDKLFGLEKQTRNAADLSSTTRLVKAIVQHSYDSRDYPLLNANINLLSKKHGQLKAAIQAMVEQVMAWLEEVRQRDGTPRWLELVETLRGVTEGKIFLETPRARVTLLLAHYHEALANKSPATPQSKESLQTASDLLSDLQVETYSSMERREKTEFILEQMRLLIAVARQKDSELGKDGKDVLGGGEAEWVKVRVGGRKINEEFLKEKDNEDLKLKYYDLMIQHALHHDSYLDVAKYYQKVWETPSIKEDENDKGKAALEHIVYYVVLAPHNNEQSDTLHHLFADPALTKLELHYNLVKCFTTRELMRWPGIKTIYGEFLRKTPVFASDKRWEDLHTRIVEHNIRVVAQYYTRITLPRLTSLLDLTTKQTEEVLARLVVSGTIWARIDRPAGVVNFRNKRDAEDVMNDWSSDMQRLLGLVEKTWMGMNAAQAAQSRVKT